MSPGEQKEVVNNCGVANEHDKVQGTFQYYLQIRL